MYAQILLPRKVTPTSGILTYEIPPELEAEIKPGDLVKMPLRKNMTNGLIWKIQAEKPAIEVKKIHGKIADQILTKWQMELLEWLRTKPLEKDYLLLKKFIPEHILLEKIALTWKKRAQVQTDTRTQNANQKNNNKILLICDRQKTKWEFLEKKIRDAVEKNKQILILTPEIEPAPIWIENLEKIAKTEILHGRKTEKQKAMTWKRVAENETKIIIASKLGSFAPMRNIGLIIITNEHSETYLEENRLRISAIEIAEKMSELTRTEMILESPFPDLQTFEKAQKENFEINKISEKTTVQMIDMRDEIKKGNFSPFSEEAEEKMQNALTKNEQIILFLNRRGIAGSLLCRDCGYLITCKNCKIALTVHKKNTLECHHCGLKKEMPAVCPRCENPRIKTLGTGTEKIEAWTRKIFPDIPLVRIDRDTIKKPKELNEVCRIFRDGLAKIAIGTSLIRPDLIQEVGLVIALLPDTTLTYPDIQSNEQTLIQLQMLKSMLKKDGEMLIQSYIPDHETYKTFLLREINPEFNEKWTKFYDTERKKRAILKTFTVTSITETAENR